MVPLNLLISLSIIRLKEQNHVSLCSGIVHSLKVLEFWLLQTFPFVSVVLSENFELKLFPKLCASHISSCISCLFCIVFSGASLTYQNHSFQVELWKQLDTLNQCFKSWITRHQQDLHVSGLCELYMAQKALSNKEVL